MEGKKDTYITGWDKRLEVDKERRSKRFYEATAAVDRCAHLLYEKYGVHKVYLIGSLTNPEVFHDKSDIDLVVEGLPTHLYFKALADLWRELPAGLELDLIPFEDADSELRKRVLEKGVELYK